MRNKPRGRRVEDFLAVEEATIGFGSKAKPREVSPFGALEGKKVSYHTNTGVVYGIFRELRSRDGGYWMEFRPSIVLDINGNPYVESEMPTVCTNYGGIMRPLAKNETLESIARNSNKKKNKSKKV